MWSDMQRARLMAEKTILDKNFPMLSWHNPTDSSKTFLEGPIKTNSGTLYHLKIFVPSTFPATCPDMTVSYPVPLLDYIRRPMTEISAEMHILGEIDGQTKICHSQPSQWLPENTLYRVALKGRIWLEAYDAHLRTGRPLHAFLRHMDKANEPSESMTAPVPRDSEEGIFVRLLRKILC